MNVYSFQYSDSGGQTSLDFSKGPTGWGIEGGSASVQLSSDANGNSLQISATAAQQTFINSVTFPVTPGSSYNLTVQARISPNSVGSGYFALIFFDEGAESSRDTLFFVPGTVALGTAQTGPNGVYTLQLGPQESSDYQAQANYAGTDTLWPAFASTALDISPAITPNGVVNGADFKAEPLSPGAWFTIFGQNLGQAGQWATPNTFRLGGATVSVCGSPAVISYSSGPLTTNGATGWQLNALMPDAVAAQTTCPVVVTVDGQTSQPAMVSIANGIMELFGFTSSVGPLPIITHADSSLVGPNSAGLVPAGPGETVVAWGTGDCSSPTLTAGGERAAVTFSGRVAPGLCQLNFVVPTALRGSNQLTVSTSLNPYVLWVAP